MAKSSHVNPAVSSGTSPTLRSRHALSIPSAASYLSCSCWYIEELLRNGEVPFRQLGKFRVIDSDDLESWLARQSKVRITRIVNGKTFTEKAA